MSLRACSSCQRHVRDYETTCPFCNSTLDSAAPRRVPNVSRMSRAARLAVGAALATAALPGCTKTSNNEGPDSTIAQPYGAPPEPTETTIAQPYGAPPEPPAPVTDAGSTNDAALSVPVPAYGAPPPAPSDK